MTERTRTLCARLVARYLVTIALVASSLMFFLIASLEQTT